MYKIIWKITSFNLKKKSGFLVQKPPKTGNSIKWLALWAFFYLIVSVYGLKDSGKVYIFFDFVRHLCKIYFLHTCEQLLTLIEL